ncbi:MAG: hypothetical protein CVU46_18535 [Chloroflexi bacterium HGW-Chloroflexi-8]|jgi:hypothetical protein|nr:MAG: hypothetical protein CVU46_18535 [Chloroflexi bacterium HGW-Chloroflexi-8]
MKNFFTHFKSLFQRFILLFVILLTFFVLAGCSGNTTTQKDLNKIAPISKLPVSVQNAPTTVKEAYQFSLSNPDALKNVPCYCGCDAAGHTSNYSCYVKEVKANGEVIFDQHALGCSICVDIAQDVITMDKDGKTPKEIRTAIDQTYSQYGPSNMPPVQ